MKRFGKFVVILLSVCLLSALLAACGSNAAKPYIGVWYGYKIETDSNSIVFADYESFVKMELTAEFSSDGEYELHYYVAGEEGEKYPQTGKYEMDGNQIILPENDGYGKIVDGELILYFSDGKVKQHFRAGP